MKEIKYLTTLLCFVFTVIDLIKNNFNLKIKIKYNTSNLLSILKGISIVKVQSNSCEDEVYLKRVIVV